MQKCSWLNTMFIFMRFLFFSLLYFKEFCLSYVVRIQIFFYGSKSSSCSLTHPVFCLLTSTRRRLTCCWCALRRSQMSENPQARRSSFLKISRILNLLFIDLMFVNFSRFGRYSLELSSLKSHSRNIICLLEIETTLPVQYNHFCY